MSIEKKKRKRGEHGPRIAPRACGPHAWDIREWCAQLGIGQSTYFRLQEKPRSVRIGKLCKIIESPSAYTARLAELQQLAA